MGTSLLAYHFHCRALKPALGEGWLDRMATNRMCVGWIVELVRLN